MSAFKVIGLDTTAEDVFRGFRITGDVNCGEPLVARVPELDIPALSYVVQALIVTRLTSIERGDSEATGVIVSAYSDWAASSMNLSVLSGDFLFEDITELPWVLTALQGGMQIGGGFGAPEMVDDAATLTFEFTDQDGNPDSELVIGVEVDVSILLLPGA